MTAKIVIGVMHFDICKSIALGPKETVEHVTEMLLRHYDSPSANHLVALGDCALLAPRIAPSGDEVHTWENPLPDVCLFYGRDREDFGTRWRTTHSEWELWNTYPDAQVMFIMREGEWQVTRSHQVWEKLKK